jgi:hypothetical protein
LTDPISGNGQASGLPPRGTGRRRSLLILGVLLLGLPLAFVIRAATDQGWREVTSVEVLEDREVIYLSQIGIFLVDGDPPVALVAESPHQGEPLVYCGAGRNFVSLAHGETFDRQGRYIDGPSPRGMDRIGLRVIEGRVEINPSVRAPGAPNTDPASPSALHCTSDDLVTIRPGFVEPRFHPLAEPASS